MLLLEIFDSTGDGRRNFLGSAGGGHLLMALMSEDDIRSNEAIRFDVVGFGHGDFGLRTAW